MSEPRMEMNATILPSGKVLAIGGSTNDEDPTTASLNADLYDPVLKTFSSAGVNAYAHLYHSTSLLLPDATVWFAGGNPEQGTYEPHMEIYQPAYLFNSNGTLATRPTITSAPASIAYGVPFTVQTPNASSISSVVLMRNGAVTHAFNMDQRMVGLSFTAGSGSLTVTAPSSGDIAPPGYYMLFLLNSAGVPSLSTMVQVPSGTPLPPPPSGINFVQSNSATANSGTSIAIPYNSLQIAGDLNVVAVMSGDTTSSISSVTDSNGNTYTRAVGPTTTTGLQQSIYYAKNIAGGSNTVTVKFNQSASYPNVNVTEYNGLNTSNPLDVSAAATGSGTTASSGSATTTSANELIVGAGNTSGHFTAAGSGFSNRLINPFGGISEDQIVNGAGAYAATATDNGGTWVMQMVAFRGSLQRSSSPPAPTAISPTSGTTSGGTSVTISGTNFASGATRHFWRNGSDQRRRGQQYHDHRHHSRTCSRSRECSSDQQQRPERDPDQRLHLHLKRNHHVRPGSFRSTYDPGFQYLCCSCLRKLADRRRPEYRGGGMGRHYFLDQFGHRQQRQHLHSGGGSDHRHRIARVHLLRQEHCRRQQHSDGHVQPGSGLSRCPHSGVQRA